MSNGDEHWPLELNYEKVRPLGRGAFGIVWLARSKDSDASEEKCVTSPTYVAIKQIHASNEEEAEYARREIDILSEIRHPNIVRCLQSVKLGSIWLVVLTLARGPNLGDLIRAGGALNISLARLAARHLISAVSYLHSRGVIHRDLKPDNCILIKNKAAYEVESKIDWMSNDALWDDSIVFTDEWRVVLVDFGFARALTPKQVGLEHNSSRRPSVGTLVHRVIAENAKNEPEKSIRKSRPIKTQPSFQKLRHALSSIGTRQFAAPEVQRARRKSKRDNALSPYVADYGLVSEAYSCGATIKMILTGVPAGENETAFLRANDSVLGSILASVCGCRSKDNRKRKKRYKFLDETPKQAQELIRKMLKVDESERLTVPSARAEPWIAGGIDSNDPVIELPAGDYPTGIDDPISCLKCAERCC